MKVEHVPRLRNWGNYPSVPAEVTTVETALEAADFVRENETLIARGNGKCYGDAALGKTVLSTLQLRQILDFDPQNGMINCESGVLLHDILKRVVPFGWFFQVTPGIKNISVGGAIACDVHGKNHPTKGCFSEWLESFELLQSDGSIVHCSKTENKSLFWQTCGGMGWTGVILSARFQLMPIQSLDMRQYAVQAPNLEHLFQAFEQHQHWTYAAAWVDTLAQGAAFGRGVLYLAEHWEVPDEQPMQYPASPQKNVPFYAPSWILNPLSIRIHNAMLFSGAKTAEQKVNLDRYFYPLDRIENWNRMYGRRGFIQYQFCVPERQAFDGMVQILQTIRKSRDMPFLSVLKRHGERPESAINSFPTKGYSLALDFPRTKTIFELVAQLDEIVWQLGGKIYLAKDACSAPKMGRIDPKGFGDPKFSSLLRERISSGK
ncbi:MAG: FAD-binding oxidoreductase [Lewinellaceae bacterium]|nr:FAD-binding oxidoreductase [Lewinellaceae bacterium]